MASRSFKIPRPGDYTQQAEETMLHRIRLAVQHVLTHEALTSIRAEVHEDFRIRCLSTAILRYCLALGEERVRTPEISYPRDWWQALRERWLPRWWLRRHPVGYTVHEKTDQPRYAAVCPHHDVNVPGPHVRWLSYATDEERGREILETEEARRHLAELGKMIYAGALCARYGPTDHADPAIAAALKAAREIRR